MSDIPGKGHIFQGQSTTMVQYCEIDDEGSDRNVQSSRDGYEDATVLHTSKCIPGADSSVAGLTQRPLDP